MIHPLFPHQVVQIRRFISMQKYGPWSGNHFLQALKNFPAEEMLERLLFLEEELDNHRKNLGRREKENELERTDIHG